MKKLILLLIAFLPCIINAQTTYNFRQDTLKHKVKGNITTTYHSDDTVRNVTNNAAFDFNKPITVNGKDPANKDTLNTFKLKLNVVSILPPGENGDMMVSDSVLYFNDGKTWHKCNNNVFLIREHDTIVSDTTLNITKNVDLSYYVKPMGGSIRVTLPEPYEVREALRITFILMGTGQFQIETLGDTTNIGNDGYTSQLVSSEGSGITVESSYNRWAIVQDSRPDQSIVSNILYFETETSDIVTYRSATSVFADLTTRTLLPYTITTTDQLLEEWITDSNIFNGVIPSNNYTISLESYQTGVLNTNANVYFRMYIRKNTGSETLISTTNISSYLSQTALETIILQGIYTEFTGKPGDRIVCKLYSSKIGIGNPVIQIGVEGTTPTRLNISVPQILSQVGAAGNNNEIQYNSSGQLFGATNLKYFGDSTDANIFTSDKVKARDSIFVKGKWYSELDSVTYAENSELIQGKDTTYLLDRDNHTGFQNISSITDLQDSLSNKINSIYVSGQNEWVGNNDTIYKIDTSNISFNSDSLNNQPGSYYLNRANHTGNYTIDTIENKIVFQDTAIFNGWINRFDNILSKEDNHLSVTGSQNLTLNAMGTGRTLYLNGYNFYGYAANNMTLVSPNPIQIGFNTDFENVETTGWRLRETIPSSTSPNILSNKSDTNTGIGNAGADKLSLISGGIEGMRVTPDTNFLINTVFNEGVKFGGVYRDTWPTVSDSYITNGSPTRLSGTESKLIIDSEITLTENITIDNKIIEFTSNGRIIGGYQITLDSTTIVATRNKIFDTNVTFLGTVYMDYVCPENFGAKCNGTDEGKELQKCFDLSQLTDNRKVSLSDGKIYRTEKDTIIFNGGIIEGNNGTIKLTYSGIQSLTHYHYGIRMYGTKGAVYQNTFNAMKASDRMQVSNSTLLNALDTGMLLKIYTNRAYYAENFKQGEIKKIRSIVGNTVTFTESFYDSYLSIDTLQLAIITPVRALIKNLKIIGNSREWGVGIHLKYSENPVIENCEFRNSYYSSVYVIDSYNGYFQYISHNNVQGSAGYGINFVGACMNDKSMLNVFVCRHPVTWNGLEGVPWNNTVYNTVAKGVFGGYAFSTHENVGSVNLLNCKVWTGLKDTANYRYNYSPDSTYNLNDVVTYEGALYTSKTNGNINHAVDTFSKAIWDLYDNQIAAYYINCDNVTIKNCEAYNSQKALAIGSHASNFIVDGLYAYNCVANIDVQNASLLKNCSFNDIYLMNNVDKEDKYTIRFINDTLYNVKFGKIVGQNVSGFYLSNIYGDKNIVVDDITSQHSFMYWGAQPDTGTSIQIKTLNCNQERGNGLYIGATTNLESVRIDNMVVENFNQTFISINNLLPWLILGNVTISCGSAPSTFISGTGVENFINTSFVSDTGGAKFYYFNGTTPVKKAFTPAVKGYFFNDVLFVGGSSPTLEIVNGNFDAPFLSRGNGSPEGVVSARTGAMYLRKDGSTGTTLYIKESSGYGNTGWVAK